MKDSNDSYETQDTNEDQAPNRIRSAARAVAREQGDQTDLEGDRRIPSDKERMDKPSEAEGPGSNMGRTHNEDPDRDCCDH